MRTTLAVVASALLASTAQAASAPDFVAGRAGSILGTKAQIAADTRAARILESATMQQAVADLEKVYNADPVAQMPDAARTLHRAAEANAMAQVLGVLAQDADRPGVLWGTTAPHAWGNVEVPLSGTMIDNPDNIYRSIPIDGAAKYVVTGHVVYQAPVQETFVLHNEKSGAKKNQKVLSQERENGSVSLDGLPVARDGSFTITLDSLPAGDRPNHIQTDPDVHDAYVLVRDTIPDWSRQVPVQLEVKRVAGPPVRPALTDEQVAQKAAAMTLGVARYFLEWARERFYAGKENTFTHQFDRASGWGAIKCGWYRLEPDEALVVRLDRRDAAYLGFQMADAWGQGQASEYMNRTGSMTADQARANADGTYTYVIAGKDPGVHNWLDTMGLRTGTYCARWQAMPEGVTTKGAVQEMQVVRLADLKSVLPPETVWMSAAQRTAQLDRRRRDYARRLRY